MTVLLPAGADLRQPLWRREVFHRFYSFHLRHRAHPGAVYQLLPALAERHGWDAEDRAWFAFLNGNTQNPVTSWLIWRAAPTLADADAAVQFWNDNYQRLAFDTDRRHHKPHFEKAVRSYAAATRGDQAGWWAAPQTWPELWRQVSGLHSFGRLSAWSYAEYGWLMGLHPHDADHLMLRDKDGSRSHRNGMCLVTGLDGYDWHASNPGFDGRYPEAVLGYLEQEAHALLSEARTRNPNEPHVSNLTLESALCTYKSWHRPRRRYPNVYNDLTYNRVVAAEIAFPEVNFAPFWQARADRLPAHLRLEDNPADPGCVPVKQDWYRLTGETVMMEHDYPDMPSGFAEKVAAEAFGKRDR